MARYFINCSTLEEVKATFHKLAKELHPDNGGNAEEFKKMMAEYTEAFNRLKNVHKNHEGQTYEKETDETPEQFADLIRTLTKMNGCIVELIGSWIWVTGNTKEYKDQLKELHFRFSAKKAAWYFHEGEYHKRNGKVYNMDDLRDMWTHKQYENDQKVLEG